MDSLDKSTEEYSRDVLAKPHKALGDLLLQIRGGKFIPDATRSGRWVEHEATKVQRSRDAVEEATDEGEPQREAQARTHEREDDMDCKGKRRVPRRSRLRGLACGLQGGQWVPRNALGLHLSSVNPRVHPSRRREGHAACGVRIRP